MINSTCIEESRFIEEDLEKEDDIPRLECYLAHQSNELSKLEAELRNLQVVVVKLRTNVAFHTQLLAQLKEQDGDPVDVEHRSPTEMLRSQYKGKKLSDVVIEVLSQKQTPLTTVELGRIIYDPQSSNEFDRARNSLSTELRSGAKAKNPKWKKVGRYAYAIL